MSSDVAHQEAPARVSRPVVLAVAGAAVVVAAFVWRISDDDAAIRLVRGEVSGVSIDGVGIGVGDEGYLVGAGRSWQGIDGSWRESGQHREALGGDG